MELVEFKDCFKKINFNISANLEFNDLKGKYIKSYGRLFYFEIKDYNYLNSCFSKLKINITPSFIVVGCIIGSGHLHPHVDHGILCSLNYYLEANDSKTNFYNKLSNSTPWRAYKEKKANIYSFDSVNPICSFKAKNNDMYLLNTQMIHSVESNSNSIRTFISWQWNENSFKEINENIFIL